MPDRRLYVKLDPEAFAALVQRARDERRHPSDQAAVVIAKALQQQDGPRAAAETAVAARENQPA